MEGSEIHTNIPQVPSFRLDSKGKIINYLPEVLSGGSPIDLILNQCGFEAEARVWNHCDGFVKDRLPRHTNDHSQGNDDIPARAYALAAARCKLQCIWEIWPRFCSKKSTQQPQYTC